MISWAVHCETEGFFPLFLEDSKGQYSNSYAVTCVLQVEFPKERNCWHANVLLFREKNVLQMFSKTEEHLQKAIPVTTWIRNV